VAGQAVEFAISRSQGLTPPENNPNEANVTKCHRNELSSQRDTKPIPMVISDER
jgi:hypothetical protein